MATEINPPGVPVGQTALVQVIAEGDSLFGKAFTFLKQLGEHFLVEIETDLGKIERVFHKDHVQIITNNIPTVTASSDVAASGVVLETAPAPVVAKPPVDTSEDAKPMAPQTGIGAPADTGAADPNKTA